MKNKNGKGGVMTGVFVGLGIIALLVILGFAFGVFQNIGGSDNNNGIPGAVGCNIAPSVNLLGTNTLVPGTSPTLSANYTIYNGAYVGSMPSSLIAGSSLDVLATASNYLNAREGISSVKCDGNDLTFAFAPYQIPTYTVYDDSYNALTDGTGDGAVNISSSANQITAQIKISGTPDKTTGDMLVVVEYSNKTEVAVSGIDMSDATTVGVPAWYSPSSVSASAKAFLVSALVDGGSETYDVTFSPESGQTIGSGDGGEGTEVLTTIYTLNPVILDTQTGTFLTENTWQDTLGADQTIANVDYDFVIYSA